MVIAFEAIEWLSNNDCPPPVDRLCPMMYCIDYCTFHCRIKIMFAYFGELLNCSNTVILYGDSDHISVET